METNYNMKSTRSAKLGCVIRPIAAEDEIEDAKPVAAPKRGVAAKSSIIRVAETREDIELEGESESKDSAAADLASLHGFKKRDKAFVYIPTKSERKPGELLKEDKKKALAAEVRARRYKPDVVADRILRQLLK